MRRRRVVITGIGAISAHGADAHSSFGQICQGRSAIRQSVLSTSGGEFEVVGAIVDDQMLAEASPPDVPTCDRAGTFALLAAGRALADARLDLDSEDTSRIGVSVGTSLGGAISQEEAYASILKNGARRLAPYTLVRVMYNGPAAHVACRYRIGGPNTTYSTTCSSSALAIGEAARQISSGYSDVMLAGGTEALFAFVSIKAWQALHVLAPPLAGDVAASCRPFSADRNGTVLGEGAAFLILEEMERAARRGAHLYAEVAGFGHCNDFSHLTQPSVDGQSRSMSLALADAEVGPSDIDYINAHGTGTVLNDLVETAAVKAVFGSDARRLAISSTKSMHGHLVGAAGAFECLITALAIDKQVIPPTAHLRKPDAECDLDYVPLIGRQGPVRAAISNSFAVGGTAASLLLARPQ